MPDQPLFPFAMATPGGARASASEQPPKPASRPASRRRLLAAAAVSAAALLASCGTRGDQETPAGPTPAGEPQDAATAAGAPPAGSVAGKLLYVADADIWLWERSTPRRLTNDRVSRQPAWSPDGKRIAHAKIDVSSSELWVMDADTANSRQLTRNYDGAVLSRNNWAFRPAWWPDGSRLLYLSEETTHDLMVWQIAVDGKNRRPFLTVPDMEGGLDMPAVSPDGRRVSVVSYRTPGMRSQVWTFTLPNGPWRQLTEHPDGAYDPAWSPDGSRIAYAVRSKGKHDVWVMGADGSNPRPVTDSGACRAPCWSPDGSLLAFVSGESGTFDLWVVSAPSPAAAAAAPQPAPAGTAAPAATAAPVKLPAARQLTRGVGIDPVSGVSWTR